MDGLIIDSAGNLYGTATEAGPGGWGTVFELQLGGQAVDGQSKDGQTVETDSDPRSKRFISAAGPAPRFSAMSSEFMPPNAPQLQPICNPTISAPVEVATSHQRYVAGTKAQPPLTDSFDWPDVQLSVLKTDGGYMFFSIDAGLHNRQLWHGQRVGNNNSGSVVRTLGTLDNPLGSAPPVDVVFSTG